MTRILLRSVAEAELAEAIAWYAARSLETARRFASQVDVTMLRIATDAESFPAIGAKLRRAVVPHFPYGIYFIVFPDVISIVGVIHSRRHPRRWLRRG